MKHTKCLYLLATITLWLAFPPFLRGQQSEGGSLIMALKSDSVSGADDVQRSLELANVTAMEMDQPPFSFSAISGVRRIDRASYDLVWNPFPAGTIADQESLTPPKLSENKTVVSVTSSPYSYLISTDHRAIVEEIELRYTERNTSDASLKTESFTKAGDVQKDSNFRGLRPGIHELTVSPDIDPVAYRVRFSVINDSEATEQNEWTDWIEWPEAKTKYFLAKLDDFRGDPKAIFEVLKGINAPLKFEDFLIREKIHYLAADLEVDADQMIAGGVGWTDKGLELTVQIPSEIKATSAWVLFPLDQQQLDQAKNLLKDWPSSPYQKMEVLLSTNGADKNLQPYPLVLPGTAGQPSSGRITSEPQWLSMPVTRSEKGTDTFFREYITDSIDDVRSRVTNAKKMLVIYERDPGRGDKFRGIITFSADQGNGAFWDERDINQTGSSPAARPTTQP